MNWLSNVLDEGDGLDSFGAEAEANDEVGFNYMALAAGAGGLLSGLSGGGASGGAAGKPDPAAAAKEQKLKDAKEAAEASASRTRLILILVGVVAAVGGLGFIMSRKPAAAAVAP